MVRTVRGVFTLVGAGVAGLLIWVSTQIGQGTLGGYWAVYGILAGAGLTMALSQLFGGWTKWGWPRISLHVFLWAFVPVAVAVLWIVIFHQPHHGLGRNHIRKWSNDIGIDGFVRDFTDYVGVLAFGLGLVFGYSFDTTGPIVDRRPSEAPPGPTVAETTTPAQPREAPSADAPPSE